MPLCPPVTSSGFMDPGSIVYFNPVGSSFGLWGWAGLSALALVVSSTILAFLYIWGNLFKNPQLTGYVKQELYEIIVSGILVITIFGFVAAFSNLNLVGFLPSSLIPAQITSVNVYSVTGQFFSEVGCDMGGWLELNYAMGMYVDQWASITPYSRPLGVGLVSSPLAGLASPIKQLLYNMSVAVSIAYIINYAQLFVYIFSLEAFFKYYLPAGIFLRCFTPTRRLGGTLLGIGMSFLIVFPAIYILSFSILYNDFNNQGSPMLNMRGMVSAFVSDATSGGFSSKFSSFFSGKFTGGFIDLVTGSFGSIGTIIQNCVGTFFLSLLLIPMSMISMGFVIGFIIPVFNILLFTQTARSLSKSFGDDVDITALTRLI
ncbi:hypothetical protein HZC07_02215 [Candidatus Micrarchaeota archaeon]|nr:hypothetical protein [Candidatus Micrarchaeota archaeon]